MEADLAGCTWTEPFAELPPDEIIFGRSDAMRPVKAILERVASTNLPVLIHGPNGTGKEVIAKLIHLRSPWRNSPFVKLNCAAIPGALLETELFGCEKGAFTGAYSTRPGRIDEAHEGILLLDEIAELGIELQAKLLQMLQDGTYCRVGGQEQRKATLRVICTTNRDLRHEISDGNFRHDLFYRIDGVSIRIPSLRERREDIPLIADYLLQIYRQMFNTVVPPLSAAFQRRLQQHSWPGNIRELENVMRRYAILGTSKALTEPVDIRPRPSLDLKKPALGDLSLKRLTKQVLSEMETRTILNVLGENGWNRKKAAAVLKISYRALLYKMHDAGISGPRPTGDGREHRQATLNSHHDFAKDSAD